MYAKIELLAGRRHATSGDASDSDLVYGGVGGNTKVYISLDSAVARTNATGNPAAFEGAVGKAKRH
jgi:hypothetical protein